MYGLLPGIVVGKSLWVALKVQDSMDRFQTGMPTYMGWLEVGKCLWKGLRQARL